MPNNLSVIIKQTRSFLRSLNLSFLLLIILMMGICIFLNYHFGIEKNFLAGLQSAPLKFAGYYMLYAFPFLSAHLLSGIFSHEKTPKKNRTFLFLLFFAPAIFAFRVNSNFHEGIVKDIFSGHQQLFWTACIGWVLRALITIIIVYIVWQLTDKNRVPFYGISKLSSLKPYIFMLLIMIPLLAWAATRNDFLEMYPRAKFLSRLKMEPKSLHYLIYELCYGFDFISIELFFRGFLILAFVRFCGVKAIIPAACFYCAIHFGKPLPEAISSFFGGSLLGIVSYHTKSIWGGLIVHLGIAWMMELAGYWGHFF